MANVIELKNKELKKRLERIEGDLSVVKELLQVIERDCFIDDDYKMICNLYDAMQDAHPRANRVATVEV